MDKSGTIKKKSLEKSGSHVKLEHDDSFQEKDRKNQQYQQNPESEVQLIEKRKPSPGNNPDNISRPSNQIMKNPSEMVCNFGPTMTSFGQFP